MKILLANPRGFCAGVNMAIECLERALDFFGPPLYVYHEIVHTNSSSTAFREARNRFRRVARRRPARLRRCSTAPTASLRRSATRPRSAGCFAIDGHLPLGHQGSPLKPVRYARDGLHHHLDRTRKATTKSIGTMGEAPKPD